MGYCPYHNQTGKSNETSGWYCNKAGRYVERSLYTHYCNDSIHCVECPIYDPERAQREREKKEREEREMREWEAEEKRREEAERRRRQQEAQQAQMRAEKPSYSVPHGGGGGGGGGGCCLPQVLIGLSVVFFGAIALYLGGLFVMGGLGFFRSTITLQTTLPEGVSHRDYAMELVSHNPEKEFKVTTKKLKKDGSVELYLETGLSSVYMIHDGMKFSLNGTALEGSADYAAEMEYQQIQDELCRMILIRLNDVNDAPVTTEDIVVQDGSGAETQWMYVAENRIMVGIPGSETGISLTITAEGYEPLTVTIDGKDRLEGIDVILQPIG